MKIEKRVSVEVVEVDGGYLFILNRYGRKIESDVIYSRPWTARRGAMRLFNRTKK